MNGPLFVGIDGGATKTIVRLEDENGCLLGEEIGGPSNIRISVQAAWNAIHATLEKLFHRLNMIQKNQWLHVGMGIAGCEILSAYQAFLARAPRFETLIVSTDAHIACLGAHYGEDGAIIIAGTGVVGYQISQGHTTKIGGWGFPHDDEGGGAWIGLQAVKATLQWLDGRSAVSNVAKAVYTHFGKNQNDLVKWANQANSTQFAELAPIVIEQSQKEDIVALNILKDAALAIDCIGHSLLAAQLPSQQLSCALVGGIAPFLIPFLHTSLRMRLSPCQLTPCAGAILLVRHHLKKGNAR